MPRRIFPLRGAHGGIIETGKSDWQVVERGWLSEISTSAWDTWIEPFLAQLASHFLALNRPEWRMQVVAHLSSLKTWLKSARFLQQLCMHFKSPASRSKSARYRHHPRFERIDLTVLKHVLDYTSSKRGTAVGTRITCCDYFVRSLSTKFLWKFLS